MVGGSGSEQHRTRLVVIPGNLTAQRYIDEVLQPVVMPLLRRHCGFDYFQHDNARSHSALICQDFFKRHGVDVLPWPALSPDLNPIEHTWDMLGRAIAGAPINSVEDLARALLEAWDNIPQKNITKVILSMHRRCQAVAVTEGGHTRY